MSFSIGEFSELVDIPSSTLRFYEKEGLITPERDKNNLRTYSEEDANWLKFLLHLKGAGLSIEELKQYTIWRTTGDSTISERLNMLKEKKVVLEQEIERLQKNLDTVVRKIGIYEEKITKRDV
ncbi:MerR family transcriptional regulator [Listeria monocytogenes]|uniref:MerR family transcriptional regulator n=1 Tax=Listeria monocytogenes TaxID=1639 RepID=UPI0011EB58F6|nr:MerR family transcriptional regulator [Listeria monocytogenes]EAE6383699.1 MerR family transcriptional regulator [Listeria monocytogenes]EAE6395661.1 MerR family transcriptional regulator [Listeria monocytogenes]EAE6533673.1 MerR family transcriptional regulator [Listeria monocytogenes]EAF2354409.1 MerR family transcriptional regulator [Listeria monocytogenes]EHK9343430.1 MerR family transcriptional regulator [Listeria monocytogenes]